MSKIELKFNTFTLQIMCQIFQIVFLNIYKIQYLGLNSMSWEGMKGILRKEPVPVSNMIDKHLFEFMEGCSIWHCGKANNGIRIGKS